MYEVGVARTFHAAHEVDSSQTAGDEHDHDYRVAAIVRGDALGDGGMLLDLDALGAAVDACLRDLDSTQLESLAAFENQITTVEIVAAHIWEHVGELIDPPPQLESLRVTVHESPEAWASVDRSLHG